MPAIDTRRRYTAPPARKTQLKNRNYFIIINWISKYLMFLCL
jgi:hypothetical protein